MSIKVVFEGSDNNQVCMFRGVRKDKQNLNPTENGLAENAFSFKKVLLYFISE